MRVLYNLGLNQCRYLANKNIIYVDWLTTGNLLSW